jgi:hypothetical protein
MASDAFADFLQTCFRSCFSDSASGRIFPGKASCAFPHLLFSPPTESGHIQPIDDSPLRKCISRERQEPKRAPQGGLHQFQLFPFLSGYKLNVVAGAQLGKWLSPQVRNMKEKYGIEVISPERGYRDLFLALNRNEIVVLLVDGNLYSGGVEVEFFGRKTLMPRGPAVLSMKTGAPIVPAHIVRRGRFKFSIDIMAPVRAPQGEKDSIAEELTEQVVSIQEKDVAEHVEQWCIFRNVWP